MGAGRRREPSASVLGRYIQPCDPTEVDSPPDGADWIHEIKWDGYRAQIHIQGPRIIIFSRKGFDWTREFRVVCEGAATLAVKNAVLDGEVVAVGKGGRPDFQELRRGLGKRSAPFRYYAFGLLVLNGDDLRERPLLERKRRLRPLLYEASETLVYVEHMKGDSRRIVHHACELGLEGIVSKEADSPYRSGRRESWRKSKCERTENFPIVAFVEKLGARPRRIASLYIGRRQGDRLVYAGKVPSGYSLPVAREVREALDPYIQIRSPLTTPVRKPKATWVQPVIDAEVVYSSLTDQGLVREAAFKRLRDDLVRTGRRALRMVSPRRVADVVPKENILQLLPDAVAPTEAQLNAYWEKVAKRALVHLGNRPLKLVRRVGDTIFYHKGPLPPIPRSVHRLTVAKREGGKGVRVWVDDLAGLHGLVEMGAVELHPWNAIVDDTEHADRLVFDLDPGVGVEWPFVIDTALELRRLLEEEGFATWPKVTGGKGLHIMAPLRDAISHDEAHRYSRALAERLAATDRGRYTVSASMAQRPGRLFIDYLRNGRGTTAAGAWSPRVRPGFPIAAPVTWRQVEAGIAPDAFTLASPFKAKRRAGR
jgi:bifunctional non-homologous end joining protein LigD